MRRAVFARRPYLDKTTGRDTRVATHLLRLVGAVMVPLLILTGVEIWRLDDSRRTLQESALLDQANDKAELIDQEFARIETAMAALSASSALEQKDFGRFEREMRTVSTQLGDLSIGLADADGTELLITSWPIGERRTGVVTGPGALAALAEGRPTITNLHKSPITGALSTAVAVPVYLHGHKRPDYAVTSVMPVARVASTIKTQPMAPSPYSDGTLLDQDGVIVTRPFNDGDVVGEQIRGPLLGLLRDGSHGFIRAGATIDGKDALFAFAKARLSGYTVAVGIPREVFNAPLRAGLIQTVGMGALLLGAGVLSAGWLARRLVGPLHRLAKSHSGQLVLTGISEIDNLALQLHRGAEERDRAQADLRQLNRELEHRVQVEVTSREAAQTRAAQAERMQALGQLAGGIAHDFNNILQVVSGSAALIERRPGDTAATHRFVRQIIDSASRGAAITRRMLVFARRGKLEAEAIDPAVLLEGLREICTYTLGPGIEIRVEVAPDLPRLFADRGQLETALVNMTTNARDAMPNGGILTLGAEPELVVGGDNHQAALTPGAYIRLSVCDTGIGMNRAVLARVAEPFFTTKGIGEGTGLGVSMVKGFTEQSGGGFSVVSETGAGTIISVWLPQADIAAACPVAVKPVPVLGIGGRLLLVDDDQLVCETLAAQLEAEGHFVLSASGAVEALALLGTTARIDLLVTDLAMPGMNGLRLIQEARHLRSRLPAILLTGYAEDAGSLAVGGAGSGSYSLIRKPVSGELLAGRIAAMLKPVV